MQVVTVASDLNNQGFVNYLKPSCDFYKLDFRVLKYDNVFYSNRIKDALLEGYLQQIGDDELIFFTDATDAAFLTEENEILDKFYHFNSPLVFSAEINCWPDTGFESIYPQTTNHFKYLNSGGFIGKAGYLKKIYQDYPIFNTVYEEPYMWSNQHYWNYIFIRERQLIKLDYNCDIFYNTSTLIGEINDFKRRMAIPDERVKLYHAEKSRLNNEIIFDHKRIRNTITNTFPCHIHFPGPVSKKLMKDGYFEDIKC